MDKKTIPQNIGAAKKILVIDDEPHILIMVAARLRANGYETFEASFGDHGIAVAKEKHPDLILLDQIMPGMRGDEVLRVLKSTPSTKDIPVMMFTADVNKVKLGEYQLLGAVDCLYKPFTPEELLGRVAAVLAKKS